MIGNPQGPGGSFRLVDKMFRKTGRRSRRRIATAKRAIGADMRVMIESTVENQAHVASCLCMFLTIFSIPLHI